MTWTEAAVLVGAALGFGGTAGWLIGLAYSNLYTLRRLEQEPPSGLREAAARARDRFRLGTFVAAPLAGALVGSVVLAGLVGTTEVLARSSIGVVVLAAMLAGAAVLAGSWREGVP